MNSPELNNINNNSSDNNLPKQSAVTLKQIKDDILFFKNDVLKDIKNFENKLNMKCDCQTSILQEKLDKYDIKLGVMTEKINSLGDKISTNISLKEKIEELFHYKQKIEGNLITQDIRIETVIRDLKNAINKYDKILLESVIYSGIIGINARFKTFHEFIDYTLLHLSQLNNFKEKNDLDLKGYKKKLEILTQGLKVQIESINKNNIEYNNKCLRDIEGKIKNIYDEYNTKFIQVRMENNKYGKSLEEKMNSLNENFKKTEKIKNDIEDKIKYEINKIGDISESFSLKFDNYQNEFNSIKKKFIVLSEFIQNNKFQKGEMKNISPKIKSNKKSNDLIEKESQEIFNQKREDINESNNIKNINKNNNINNISNNNSKITSKNNSNTNFYNKSHSKKKNSENVPLLKQSFHEDDKLKDLYEEPKEIIKRKSSKNINNTFSNNLVISNEIELIIIQGKKHELRDKVIKYKNSTTNNTPLKQYINLRSNNYTLNYINKNGNENINENILIKDANIDIKKKNNNVHKRNINDFRDEDKIENDNIYNLGDISNGDLYHKIAKSVESYGKKINSLNDYFEYKNKMINNKINYNIGLDDKSNSLLKGYTSENDIFDINNGIISIINYGHNKKQKIFKNNKQFPFLENKKDIKDEEIKLNIYRKINDKQNNNILNKKNNLNSSEVLSNTFSLPFKKIDNNNSFLFKNKRNINHVKDMKNNNINSFKNNSNSFIINKRFLESDYKKLNPIKLKGNNSTSDMVEKRINEIELCYDEDKKFEKLMNKVKEIIPLEENYSLSDRNNLGKINKNIFSKKFNYLDNKEINKSIQKGNEKINNEIHILKLNSILTKSPKINKNINNKSNLLNNQ